MEEKLDKLLKRQTVLIGVIILLGAALLLAHTAIRRLDERMTQMQNTVGQLDSKTQREIQSGLAQMQNILDQQASMLADGRITVGELKKDGENLSVAVNLAVVPKQVTPGAKVSLRLLDDNYPDWSMTLPAALEEDGITYTSYGEIPMIRELRVQIIVEKNGVKAVEYLPWYEPIQDRFFMGVDIGGSGVRGRQKGDKVEWDMEYDIHCYDKFYDDQPDQSPVSGTAFMVLNGEVAETYPIVFDQEPGFESRGKVKINTALQAGLEDQVDIVLEVADNHGFTYRRTFHELPLDRPNRGDEEYAILYGGKDLLKGPEIPQEK